MSYQPKCGDTDDHDYHTFIDTHFKDQWCSGVCGCDMSHYPTPHGQGEHK